MVDAAYVEGVLDAKLLGIELAKGRIEGTATGIHFSGEVDWLAGLKVEGELGYDLRPIPVPAFFGLPDAIRDFFGGIPDFDGNTVLVPFPTAFLQASIDTEDALRDILSHWGIDLSIFQPRLPDGGATFRAYFPGFDPDSDDPLLRNGGIEVQADLSIPGLLDSANFLHGIIIHNLDEAPIGFTFSRFRPVPLPYGAVPRGRALSAI